MTGIERPDESGKVLGSVTIDGSEDRQQPRWRIEDVIGTVNRVAADLSGRDKIAAAIEVLREEREWRWSEHDREIALGDSRRRRARRRHRLRVARIDRVWLRSLAVALLATVALIGWRATRILPAPVPTAAPTPLATPTSSMISDPPPHSHLATLSITVLLIIAAAFLIYGIVGVVRARPNAASAPAKADQEAHKTNTAFFVTQLVAAVSALWSLGHAWSFATPLLFTPLAWWLTGLSAASRVGARIAVMPVALLSSLALILISIWPEDLRPALYGSHLSPGWSWLAINCYKVAASAGAEQWRAAVIAVVMFMLAAAAPDLAREIAKLSEKQPKAAENEPTAVEA